MVLSLCWVTAVPSCPLADATGVPPGASPKMIAGVSQASIWLQWQTQTRGGVPGSGPWTLLMSSRVARPLRRNGTWTGLSGSCSCQPQNAPKRRISGASLGGSRPGGETPPPHGHVSVAIRGVPGGWAAGNGCPGVGLFVAPWDKYPARLRSAGETNTHQTFLPCSLVLYLLPLL